MLKDENPTQPKTDDSQMLEVAIKFTQDALRLLQDGKTKAPVCARKLVAAAAIINGHEMHIDEKVEHELLALMLRNMELEKLLNEAQHKP